MIGDFDGDADADVVVRREVDGHVQFVILVNDGDTLRPDTARIVDLPDLLADEVGAVAADATGDGVTDIVALDRRNGEVRLIVYGQGQADGSRFTLSEDTSDTVLVGVSR